MLSNTATNERSSFLISNLVARLVEEELQQLISDVTRVQ